jgi:siroheme synthase (precorrin-2 oxidase/ferrochelatase)
MSTFPFFPLALKLEGKPCVVIGAADDPEATAKEAALREAGADVKWIQNPTAFREEDVDDAFLVISTPLDDALGARLAHLAQQHRFLLCCIDQPAYGSVAMAAIAKAGPVRVAISTAGLAPRVGKLLKEALQRAMDERFIHFVDRIAQRRFQARRRFPERAQATQRRNAMIEAAEGFEAKVVFSYPQWFEDCRTKRQQSPSAGGATAEGGGRRDAER